MKKIVTLLLAAMLMLAFAAHAEPARLTVRGTGVVSLNADTATIVLGVREVSEDVVDAQAVVNEKLAKVVDALKEAGIDMSDIHTNSISIYPEYNYDVSSTPVVGYSAENSISVQTTDTENVGKYIDTAFEAGANTFIDVSFSASDNSAESNQALTLAINNAVEKAKVMAEALGSGLGALVSVSEAEYSYVSDDAAYAKAETADSGAGTEIYASPLQVSATVIVQFELDAVD